GLRNVRVRRHQPGSALTRPADQQLGDRADTCERARLVSGPEHVLLAVGGDLGIEHRERRTCTGHRETSRREPDTSGASDTLLRRIDHRLDVAQGRIEVVTLVQSIAVGATELILPERLPLGEHQLLELAMRSDEDQRRTGFEADPSLDAERGLAHVNTVTDAELRGTHREGVDDLVTGHRLAIE